MIGDPEFRVYPVRPRNGCLSLGGPITDGKGEFADCGLRSCGGDEAKHSSADISGGAGSGSPLPNLNGGSWLSALAELKETELVV